MGACSLPCLQCSFHGITSVTGPKEVGRDQSWLPAGTIAYTYDSLNLQMSKENVEPSGQAGNTSCRLDTWKLEIQ